MCIKCENFSTVYDTLFTKKGYKDFNFDDSTNFESYLTYMTSPVKLKSRSGSQVQANLIILYAYWRVWTANV